MRRLALSLIAAVVAAGGGYLLGSVRAAPPAAAVHGPTERSAPAVTQRGERGLSEAELRRIVQEELAAARTAPAPGPAAEPAPSAPPAPSPSPSGGDPRAYDDAMRRVDQAIAQRRWTREDAAALGRALDTTSPEQRTAVLHRLAPAINRGEIKLAYRGAAVQ